MKYNLKYQIKIFMQMKKSILIQWPHFPKSNIKNNVNIAHFSDLSKQYFIH